MYTIFFKKLLDVSIIVLFSPPILLILLIIILLLKKPRIFIQERPGKENLPFKLYKFRTMKDIRAKGGDLLPDEYRITKFGKFLRKTSLDELPELFNVLKGEMSLVGPRPLLMEYLPLYSKNQARRHEVRPGITGWAQINGRNNLTWGKKFEMDVWYVDNISFLLDFKILLLTLWKVLKREGISQSGHATAEKFTGNN